MMKVLEVNVDDVGLGGVYALVKSVIRDSEALGHRRVLCGYDRPAMDPACRLLQEHIEAAAKRRL